MAIDTAEAAADARRLRRCFSMALAFTLALWLIKLGELALGLDLAHYGVYPRSLTGLRGVLLGPLIHGSLVHLISNTLPVIVLGTALLYGYPRAAKWVIPVLYIGSGVAVWVFGRSAWHIGASGLTFGTMFFVFCIGVLRRDTRSIGLALAVFLLYGGMLGGLFPGDPSISFESHAAGALLGVCLAILLKNRDPAPPPRRYSWEDETDTEPSDAEADSDQHGPDSR